MSGEVRTAYSRRAGEYAGLLGTMDAVHPSDRALVELWADGIAGPAIDAGCGPGHWADHLARRGLDVRGVDLVPAFVELARHHYPSVAFDVCDLAAAGGLGALGIGDGSVGGVLAWYSLIHVEPAVIQTPLRELARVLRPGGDILVGFCEGSVMEAFDHAVVTAYRWSVDALEEELRSAGFEVLETHTRTQPGRRPHGAILARRC